MTWLKYDNAPIMNDEFWDHTQNNESYSFEKPKGCWITDDSNDCWQTWCLSEQFNLSNLTHKHQIILDESNILIIRSIPELDAFNADYLIDEMRGAIDWKRVAQKYDGIIITPYQWKRRMQFNWYYGWDCASGCIWKAKAILEIKLLEINKVEQLQAVA